VAPEVYTCSLSCRPVVPETVRVRGNQVQRIQVVPLPDRAAPSL